MGPAGAAGMCNGPNCPGPNGVMSPGGMLPGAIPPGGLTPGMQPTPNAQAAPRGGLNGPALSPASSPEALPAPLPKETPNSASVRPRNNRVVQAGAQQRVDVNPPARRARPGLIAPTSATTTAPAQRPVSATP